MVERGADVNAKNDAGATSLIRAAFYGYAPIVRKLLEKQADVNAANERGYTPLLAAVNFFGDETSDRVEIVRALIKAGADVNVKYKDGDELKTPLLFATQQGHAQILQMLRQARARY
ncbi:MAG: ankyrin repeat domain-containing protein [Pyrinomonadaceae bacterium]